MSLMLASLAMQGVGMGLNALQQKKQRELQEKMAQQAIPTTTAVGNVGMKYGGRLREYMTGGKLKSYGKGGKYVGKSHEEGGIPVDASGNPTDRNKAVAEVEGGETVQNQMIFSDSILVPGTDMTFAQAHEKLMQEQGTDEEVQELFSMQETLKAESPQASNAEMEQMPIEQNQEVPETPEMVDGGLLAQRLAPSVMQLGLAAFTKRPKKIKPNLVTPEKEQVDRSLYNQQRSDIATSARTAVDGGGRADIVHAQTLKGMSSATANQNQRQVDVDNRNVQTANRAKEVNAQAKQQAQLQNLQRTEQDKAARINLISQAITQPLNAYAQDKAIEKQNLANIAIAGAAIKDIDTQKEYYRNTAKMLGIPEEKLLKMFSEDKVKTATSTTETASATETQESVLPTQQPIDTMGAPPPLPASEIADMEAYDANIAKDINNIRNKKLSTATINSQNAIFAGQKQQKARNYANSQIDINNQLDEALMSSKAENARVENRNAKVPLNRDLGRVVTNPKIIEARAITSKQLQPVNSAKQQVILSKLNELQPMEIEAAKKYSGKRSQIAAKLGISLADLEKAMGL